MSESDSGRGHSEPSAAVSDVAQERSEGQSGITQELERIGFESIGMSTMSTSSPSADSSSNLSNYFDALPGSGSDSSFEISPPQAQSTPKPGKELPNLRAGVKRKLEEFSKCPDPQSKFASFHTVTKTSDEFNKGHIAESSAMKAESTSQYRDRNEVGDGRNHRVRRSTI